LRVSVLEHETSCIIIILVSHTVLISGTVPILFKPLSSNPTLLTTIVLHKSVFSGSQMFGFAASGLKHFLLHSSIAPTGRKINRRYYLKAVWLNVRRDFRDFPAFCNDAAMAIWCLFLLDFPGPNVGLSKVSEMLELMVSWLLPDARGIVIHRSSAEQL
jgi:hypothetical protein